MSSAKKMYVSEFEQADLDKDGVISPQEALKFFTKSKLPKATLSRIWKSTAKDGVMRLPEVRRGPPPRTHTPPRARAGGRATRADRATQPLLAAS